MRSKRNIIYLSLAIFLFLYFLIKTSYCAFLSTPYRNWGLYNSEGNSDIDVLDAWDLEEGSKKVIVAVLDTGIDPNQPDLEPNLWRDPKDSSIYGWDFVSDKSNPIDSHGHGSHISGIIGAISDKKAGISGVAHKVSIMSVKYFDPKNDGSTNLANTIKALNYAIDHRANIINYSGGGQNFSEPEYLAVKKAEERGILVVAAAGNEHSNTDSAQNHYYPADYGTTNVISVAASDINNNLLVSSNWGKNSVDISAPGENIYSTLPNGKYGYMTGTSQATAFVTGVAVLLLSKNPRLTPAQIKTIIIQSADLFPQQKDKTVSGGRVNAFSALKLLNKKMLDKKSKL